jgi:hypothetical protein
LLRPKPSTPSQLPTSDVLHGDTTWEELDAGSNRISMKRAVMVSFGVTTTTSTSGTSSGMLED